MTYQKITPIRRRNISTIRYRTAGVVASIKTGGKQRHAYACIRLSQGIMDRMQFLIGDSIDIYFDQSTCELVIFRNPFGDFVLRKLDGRSKDSSPGCQVKVSNLPGLIPVETGTHVVEFNTDTDKNPNRISITLPKKFFRTENPFLQLRVA